MVISSNSEVINLQSFAKGPKAQCSRYDHTEWLQDWYQEKGEINLKSADVLPLLSEAQDCFFPRGIRAVV